MMPALSDSKYLRYFSFFLLYMAQGLPYAMLVVALPAFMAEKGLTAVEVSAFVGLILTPWSLKVLNGPVMDRWTLRSMGRRRPWVLLAQLAVVAGLAAIALVPAPLEQLTALTALGVLINLATAFQDVAVDGLAIESVPVEEQEVTNGLMWGGRTLGVAVSTIASTRLMEAGGLALAALACAGAVGLIALVPLLVRERPGERLLPWTRGDAAPVPADAEPPTLAGIVVDLLRALLLPASLAVLAAVLLYSTAHGLWTAGLPLIAVQELGWASTWYGDVMATANLVTGLLGMAVGGLLVRRLGRVRTLRAAFVTLAVTTALIGALPSWWTDPTWAAAAVFAYTLLRVFGSIAFFATAMALCWSRVAATQYALYMAVSNLGTSLGSALLGPWQAMSSWPGVFWAMAGLLAVATALVSAVYLDDHQKRLSRLEAG